MANTDCKINMKKQFPEFDEKIIKDLLNDVRSIKQREEMFKQKSKTYRDQKMLELQIRRSEAIDRANKAQKNMVEVTEGKYKGNEAEGIRRLFDNAVDSVGNIKHVIKKKLDAYFDIGLHDLGPEAIRTMKTGAKDREIAIELANPGSIKDKEVVAIAKIIRKVQNSAHTERRNAGITENYMENYVFRSTHDADIIGDAVKTDWVGDAYEAMAVDKIFPEFAGDEVRIKGALAEIYDEITAGRYNGLGGITGEKKSRVLHFDDGGKFWDYNQKYGGGKSMLDNIKLSIDRTASESALVSKFGARPQEGYKTLLDSVEKSLKGEAQGRFTNARHGGGPIGNLETLYRQFDPILNRAGTDLVAKSMEWLRGWQVLTKLGSAVLSAGTDLPVAAAILRTKDGGGLYSRYTGLIKDFVGSLPKKARIEQYKQLGLYMEDMLGESYTRMISDFSQKGLSNATQMFFRLTGFNWQTAASKMAGAKALSRLMASRAKKETLSELDIADLADAGISLKEFDAMRGGVEKLKQAFFDAEDGMTPEAIRRLPEESFAGLKADFDAKQKNLPKDKRKTFDWEGAREELAMKLTKYLSKETMDTTPTPTALETNALTGKAIPGTKSGEFLRMITQFKSFPLAMHRIAKKIAIKPGSESVTLKQAWANGDINSPALFEFIAATTSMAAMILILKDLKDGKEPRKIDGKFMARALMQGGGLGLWGDFLLQEHDKNFGYGLAQQMAGPSVATAQDALSLMGSAVKLDGEKVTKKSYHFFRKHMLPMQNNWYTKRASELLILDRLQETADPGSLDRAKRRWERENE
jgi:hypothetical protein